MSEHYPTGKRYDTPAERYGVEPNSVIGRGLNSYAHDPESVLAEIESQLAKLNSSPERLSTAASKTAKRTAEIAVVSTVELMPNKDEYWDDAPQVPPASVNSYTNRPAPLPPLADRYIPEKYIGRAPQLPRQR